MAAMMEAASFRNWLAHTDMDLVPGIEIRQGPVNISVPKLDIDASQDLIDSLAALGIRRCFETDQADLSPCLDFPGVCVGSAKQCSRLLLDEKGVIAASAVIMTGAAATPQDRIINFVVDRPFFLLITGPEAVPLSTTPAFSSASPLRWKPDSGTALQSFSVSVGNARAELCSFPSAEIIAGPIRPYSGWASISRIKVRKASSLTTVSLSRMQ